MNIGFIGLGKLGLPCALAVESRGHSVVGYDPSQQVKEIVDTKKLQYQEIWAQEHLEKSKIQIKYNSCNVSCCKSQIRLISFIMV